MIDRKDNSKLLRKRSFVLGGLKTLFTLIVFGSAAIINFCNFMDGIDGILTGSILIILISVLLVILDYHY